MFHKQACLKVIGWQWMIAMLFAMPGCGGSATTSVTPLDTTAANQAGQGAEASCLEAANAVREKRPDEPTSIGVKHVLVRYAGAERAEGVTRTREQGCLRAMEARDKIRGGADFAEVVKEYSEESGAETREGSLGQIERSDVLPPFADAAFELEINQLSDVVETKYGFHIILRTE